MISFVKSNLQIAPMLPWVCSVIDHRSDVKMWQEQKSGAQGATECVAGVFIINGCLLSSITEQTHVKMQSICFM